MKKKNSIKFLCGSKVVGLTSWRREKRDSSICTNVASLRNEHALYLCEFLDMKFN